MTEEKELRVTNSHQSLATLRHKVWQQSEEIDRLHSVIVALQARVDHISGVCRKLLFSMMTLSAIVAGMFIGLIVTLI